MTKAWSMRLHRWVALVSALPLLGVVITGLILSFEPIVVVGSQTPGSITVERVVALLATHDPRGTARSLSIRAHDGTLSFSDADGERTDIDLATGLATDPDRFLWGDVIGWARGAHETLLLEEGWLVEASTWAMLALVPLGLLMGFARPRATARKRICRS